MRIRAPAAPGRYVIALGFVRERVAWFGNASFVILQVAVPPVSSDRSVRSRRKGKTAAVKLAKVA
jgi:hypothetical protein